MDRVKRIWYLSSMRAAKVQASLRIRAVSPEPPLLAHTSSESRGTFRQKARSLASLNGWACVVKTCHDGMLEDTNSLDGAHLILILNYSALFTDIQMYTLAFSFHSQRGWKSTSFKSDKSRGFCSYQYVLIPFNIFKDFGGLNLECVIRPVEDHFMLSNCIDYH